jgi:hypothetical protein
MTRMMRIVVVLMKPPLAYSQNSRSATRLVRGTTGASNWRPLMNMAGPLRRRHVQKG